MPFLGLTRCGRKALPSVGSFANSGALKALAARRLALRRLDCLRFGLAMRGVFECVLSVYESSLILNERVGVKGGLKTRQASSLPVVLPVKHQGQRDRHSNAIPRENAEPVAG
jgi:hypothetical protein